MWPADTCSNRAFEKWSHCFWAKVLRWYERRPNPKQLFTIPGWLIMGAHWLPLFGLAMERLYVKHLRFYLPPFPCSVPGILSFMILHGSFITARPRVSSVSMVGSSGTSLLDGYWQRYTYNPQVFRFDVPNVSFQIWLWQGEGTIYIPLQGTNNSTITIAWAHVVCLYCSCSLVCPFKPVENYCNWSGTFPFHTAQLIYPEKSWVDQRVQNMLFYVFLGLKQHAFFCDECVSQHSLHPA